MRMARLRGFKPSGFARGVALIVLLSAFGWCLFVAAIDRQQQREATAYAQERLGLRADASQRKLDTEFQAMEWLFQLAEVRLTLARRGDLAVAEIDSRISALTVARLGGVLQVALIDADGISRWSSISGAINTDLSDRAHFTTHIDSDHGLFVSAPLQGRVSGQWSIQFSKRVNQPDGSFGGVIVISMDPVYLARTLGETASQPQETIGLFRPDGLLLARAGMTEEVLERGYRSALIPQQEGGFDTRSSVSLAGGDRFVAIRKLHNMPLLVGRSTTVSAELVGYQSARQTRLLAALLGVAMVFAAGTAAVALHSRASQVREATLAGQRAAETARILDALSYAVMIAAPNATGDWRITYTNKAWAQLGLPLDAPAVATLLAALAHEEQVAQEARLRVPDGTERWARLHGKLLHDGVSGPEAICLIQDIEQERSAAAAAMSASRLATLGELSAGLAHELSQPLTVVSLAAELIEMLSKDAGEPLAAMIGERSRIIADMVARARSITDHLRRFSRQEDEEVVPVVLGDVLDGAVLLVGNALRANQVALCCNLAPGLPPVWGNQVLLEQVLMNLMMNACQAMADQPSGQRRLNVSAAVEGEDVVLHVRDTGPGIPAENIDRLFEPFYTTKPAGQGTGLGLAICQGIIASAGGTITAGNSDEGGADFVVHLQAAVLSEQEAGA